MLFGAAAKASKGMGLLQGLGVGGAAMGLLGFMGQRRNDRKLLNYASNADNFAIDTSGLKGMLGDLQGQNLEAQALRDARASGIGFDQGRFNASMRGAGRNAFGIQRQEAMQRGQNQFGSAVMGRLGQLQSQNVQQQIGLNNSIAGFSGQSRQMQNQMMGQARGQINQRYGGLADMGTGLMGMYTANRLG